MSVRFILGRPGTGKTTLCMKEIRKQLSDNPSGTPLVYLVPEHMTFSMEYAFAAAPGFSGMTRLNVYSIPRLALRVLQRTGGATRIHLNNVGLSMMLQRIISGNSEKLHLFRKASAQTGFYDLLGQTLAEMKSYCLTPGQLADQSEALEKEQSPERMLLRDKLHDLAIVYEALEKELEGKYVDNTDYLILMARKIPETNFLKQAELWIDGFQTMTPEEQVVVGQLMAVCRRTTIVLGTDQAYDRPPDEFSVFRHPALLYMKFREMAAAQQLAMEPPVILRDVVRAKTPALKRLNLLSGNFTRPVAEKADGLILTEAVNRREEVEQAARNLIALVRDRHLRFREITVLVRDLDDYHDLIETVFADYGIPIFIDRKRPMKQHPLIELIRSALETVQKNWQYDSVFRCIKTDLLIPEGAVLQDARESLSQLENYVMAYGIFGEKKWTDPEPWTYRVYRGLQESEKEVTHEELKAQQEINHWRAIVARPISRMEKQIRAAADVQGKCKAVYDFLVACAVPEKLEQMAAMSARADRLSEAKEHSQVWKAVLDLLDQCVEGAGDEPISDRLFTEIMDTGLDQLEFALVPPALDQVLIGSMDRMRSTNPKAVFLLGVNEGVIPAKPSDHGLLTGEDREQLERQGLQSGDDEHSQMALEKELAYRALTLPEEWLYLSYPLASEGGENLKPSPLIGRMRRTFSDLHVRLALTEPRSLAEPEQLGFVNAPRKTLGYLTSQIRDWRRGYKIADLWWDIYNWFTAHAEWKPFARRTLSGLFATNEEYLSTETAHQLYGDTLLASVSRMELYSACPFSQFASYGLKLQERDIFQLAAPDIGQLFHLAIKKMTESLMKHHRRWRDLSPEACDELAEKTVDTLAPHLQRRILSSSGRYRYLQHKLEQVVARVARVMQRQDETSGFTPVSLELPFGPGQPLPPLNFTLKNGCKMEIVGRIDRVDRAEDPDRRVFLRVIDYKSGLKDLNLNDVYYGLALQMLTYLDVVLTHSNRWLGVQAHPAGVLYFHVHNPSLALNGKVPTDEAENDLYKSFKMKGLLLEDQQALALTDELAPGTRSQVAPFGIKKDGSFTKSSSLATPEQFQALQVHTKKVIADIGEKITEGDVRIAPFKFRDRIPCAFCPYRSFCQFDRSQPGNDFRELKKISDDQILQKLTEKEEDKHGHEET
ncbi:helicase-exonuclease AddAB subunit AddB [Sporolactobacillus vineae]|uniref:helicase-exonuclease AddAB subunit AddB n=1 Tax=Sporolactobacillus vineae TaxID=444463 RepID=UPI000287CD98|nr:helicase-exonuclease AddAB subunit AddB [Sporolactobacillus vineae]